MKKYGVVWIIIDILFAIGALLDVCTGAADMDDYVVLYFSISILVALIIRSICNEIKIRKRLKEMQQEKNEKSGGQQSD